METTSSGHDWLWAHYQQRRDDVCRVPRAENDGAYLLLVRAVSRGDGSRVCLSPLGSVCLFEMMCTVVSSMNNVRVQVGIRRRDEQWGLGTWRRGGKHDRTTAGQQIGGERR